MKNLLLVFACWLFATSATAQDIILLRNADEIEAVVREITDTDVLYRKFAEPEGATLTLARSLIFSITYANGQKELFLENQPRSTVAGEYPYPPVSRSYALGELFDEGGVRGLVIRVTDQGRHGLILSLEQGRGYWSDPKTAKYVVTGCTDCEDGWKNMQILQALIANTSLLWPNFPAAAWCRALGDGWYLPAQRELECLWNFGPANPAFSIKEHRKAIQNLNAYLENYDSPQCPMWGMKSSTEISPQMAFELINTNALLKLYTKGSLKTVEHYIRAVHKF